MNINSRSAAQNMWVLDHACAPNVQPRLSTTPDQVHSQPHWGIWLNWLPEFLRRAEIHFFSDFTVSQHWTEPSQALYWIIVSAALKLQKHALARTFVLRMTDQKPWHQTLATSTEKIWHMNLTVRTLCVQMIPLKVPSSELEIPGVGTCVRSSLGIFQSSSSIAVNHDQSRASCQHSFWFTDMASSTGSLLLLSSC